MANGTIHVEPKRIVELCATQLSAGQTLSFTMSDIPTNYEFIEISVREVDSYVRGSVLVPKRGTTISDALVSVNYGGSLQSLSVRFSNNTIVNNSSFAAIVYIYGFR